MNKEKTMDRPVIRTTPIVLNDREHSYIVQVGPWPFTRFMNEVRWLGKDDEEILTFFGRQNNPRAQSIVNKLRRANRDRLLATPDRTQAFTDEVARITSEQLARSLDAAAEPLASEPTP